MIGFQIDEVNFHGVAALSDHIIMAWQRSPLFSNTEGTFLHVSYALETVFLNYIIKSMEII